jgi:hypothetical protein
VRTLLLSFVCATLMGCNVGPKQSSNGGAQAEGTQATFNMDTNTWSSTADRPISGIQQDTEGTNKFAHGQFFDLSAIVPYIPEGEQPPTFLESEEIVGYTEDGTPLTKKTFSPFLVRVFSSDPANRSLDDFFAGVEGGWHMRVGGMTQDQAATIMAYDTQLTQAYAAQGKITEEEAKVMIELISKGFTFAEAAVTAGVDIAKLFAPVP